jgi:hypothetical protein
VRIGVNNPFSYQAAYRAGFTYTGEQQGLAVLELVWPGDRSADRYQAGLDVFRERDLADDEESFLADKRGSEPPAVLSDPGDSNH